MRGNSLVPFLEGLRAATPSGYSAVSEKPELETMQGAGSLPNPVHKKKRITAEHVLSTSEASSPMPEQQEFHQHLRTLAQSAVRTVLELVMREELDAFIGAAWGACSPKRKGYRNGTYTRDLATAAGRLEDLKVPRDREGHFHTQAFERYQRYEPHIAEGLTQMFVAGVSTHKVGEIAQTLLGVAPSASTI